MKIEYIFWVVGEVEPISDTDRIKTAVEELKDIKEFGNFELVSITFMGGYLVVLVDFKDMEKVDWDAEMRIDALAGAIVYAMMGRVRYRHFEIHGVTRSLLYLYDWEKGTYI